LFHDRRFKKDEAPALYLGMDPTGLALGAGMWRFLPLQRAVFRERVVTEPSESGFARAIAVEGSSKPPLPEPDKALGGTARRSPFQVLRTGTGRPHAHFAALETLHSPHLPSGGYPNIPTDPLISKPASRSCPREDTAQSDYCPPAFHQTEDRSFSSCPPKQSFGSTELYFGLCK